MGASIMYCGVFDKKRTESTTNGKAFTQVPSDTYKMDTRTAIFMPKPVMAILCAEDFHVHSNTCIACQAGSSRSSGDNALEDDTECSDPNNAAGTNVGLAVLIPLWASMF